MDSTLITVFGKSCALEFHPSFFKGTCVEFDDANAGIADSPFGDAYVLSFGFGVVAALAIPLGYFNVEDNILVQMVSDDLLCSFPAAHCAPSPLPHASAANIVHSGAVSS